MTPERWIQVKSILEATLSQPLPDRSAFASEACGADEELFGEVESLLAFDGCEEKDIFENGRLSPDADAPTDEYTNGFIGKKIDKYRIVSELGAGGMGVVFLAERTDGEFEQKVAIKFLRHFFSQNAFQLFLLERQILARLHHRFIAQLIDGGTTAEGTPYLVMEYVEGISITDYAAVENLNLQERLDLFCKVCSAVSFAHHNLIVHRDLKPDNILITNDGTPKLLDFGIAKLLSETEIKATVTRRQAFTPEYASPEQITGGAITTASDVYVLGIILYKLLSGKRPFQAVNTAAQKEIWHVVNHAEPMKPSSLGKREGEKSGKLPNLSSSQLKGDLDNIILKALKREPERRYQSIEQLTDDLSRYEKGLPVKARADTFFYRTAKFVGRHRFGLIAISLVMLSLLIGLVATLQQSRRAERERLRAEQRAENLRAISKSVVFDIHDAIRNLPGSLPARELLLKQAVEQLRVSAQDAEDNPVMQDELAQAYFNVGEMQQALGNVAEAEESHRRAVTIYRKLTAENPRESAYMLGLARSYGFLANMPYLRGEAGKSSEIYAEAVNILEQIVAENPNDVKNSGELWSAYSEYSSSLDKLGKTDAALTAAEKALAIANKLNQVENSNASQQNAVQTKGLIGAVYGSRANTKKPSRCSKKRSVKLKKCAMSFPTTRAFNIICGRIAAGSESFTTRREISAKQSII